MTASIPTPHSFEDHRIDNLYDCEGRPSADALFAAYSIIMETLPALVEADGALARLDAKILGLASETLHRLYLWTLYATQHPEAYELGVLCERCLEIGRDDTNYRAPAAGCCEGCTEEAAEGVAEGEEETGALETGAAEAAARAAERAVEAAWAAAEAEVDAKWEAAALAAAIARNRAIDDPVGKSYERYRTEGP